MNNVSKKNSTSKRPSEASNKGKLFGQKPPLTLKELKVIRKQLAEQGKTRDLAMFNLALDSSLGPNDLVQLRLKDIAKGGVIAPTVTILSTQTRHRVRFDISDETRQAVETLIAEKSLKSTSYLFPSRLNDSPHISTRQYARMVESWVSLAGLNPADYGTQSLRRTKPMMIFSKSRDLEVARILLGHARLRSTARFLGIELV